MTKITRHRLKLGAVSLAASAALAGVVAGVALADPLGTQTRVSVQGPGNGTGNAAYDATDAAIAYNDNRNNYLAVWRGPTPTNSGDIEIWARLVGADGVPTGGVIRVSNMGGPNDAVYDAAVAPKVAYNSAADEYLVVWYGDDNSAGLANGEEEIWGRRIKGDGTFGSDQFKISEMGANGDGFEGFQPDVVYNPDLDQYAVVWYGDQPTPGNADAEIWGRRLNPDGTSIDGDEVRISDMGAANGTTTPGRDPEIAWDPDAKQYLVVWEGADVANQFKIYGQRLGQGFGPVGTNDFAISGTAAAAGAFDPEVAYNSTEKRFMVVWRENRMSVGEIEVYGQLLDANGSEVGTDDFRVSTSGPDGDANYDALDPMVVANTRASEFMVVYRGDDDQTGLILNADEIFAQRYTGGGVPVGTPEVRVSTMGPDNDTAYVAAGPTAAAYNGSTGEYLIGWEGEDNTGGLVANEYEVYVRRHGAGTATEPFPPNCKPVPARGTPNEVNPPSTITAGYLRTNQRTGSATVRRANALDSWLNGGIVDKDLCGGAVGPAELHPNLTATSGALGPAPTQADPRPVNIPSAGNSNATFTASAIQMCINQRIYQTAIARANALKARLGGELTGGDLTDTTLTQSRLRQDLTITAATDAPAPAKSTTDVKTPTRQGCDAVKFTTAQAAINRRIAIQSVVRINEVLDEVNSGLDGANFKDGTLTKADFAAGVTP